MSSEFGGVPSAERSPLSPAGGFAELHRQVDERVPADDLCADRWCRARCQRCRGGKLRVEQGPAGALDGVEKHLGVREVTEQRHDIGEGLVERRNVRVGLLHEESADAVDDGVGHLVHDDVM